MNLSKLTPPAADNLAPFVAELARFFCSDHIVHFDWEASGALRVEEHTGTGTVRAAREWSSDTTVPPPHTDGAYETVFNLGSLAALPSATVESWLAELHRMVGQNVWLSLPAQPGRDQMWWERKFFEAGFRKHPLMMLVAPFPEEERDTSKIVIVLEKIPAAALALYPLAALQAERDLHMDMLREAGVRSEAHLARYQLATLHAPERGAILDAACGLGYGCAMLARQFPGTRVIGVDISEYAIAYARANFAAVLPNLEFHLADACDLKMVAEDSVDLVVSFETIEHVPDPELFLRGIQRRMKAGACFIGSVPNLWLDETGKDPNPWHFHVFDLPKFYQLISGFLQVSHVYRENAGGHLRNPKAGPDMREVRLPVTDQLEEAEWWLISAQKPHPQGCVVGPKPLVWLVDGHTRPQLYAQLQGVMEAEWLVGPDIAPEALDLAIVSDEWYCENSLRIQQMKRLGVPTLHVVDGVVDWKNTWENPRSQHPDAGLPLFQPILCDKIACLGPAQARVLNAWGNAAKCELVGAPRFDRYYARKRRTRHVDEPARILVLTANTAYFNEEQHATILAGLKDLRDFFCAVASNGIPIEPVWRLTSGLNEELGLPPAEKGRALDDLLATVDAVVGSSSTALLEAMLLGLPTALLDYANVPHYLQPAWQITAEPHIGTVLGELLNPSAARMLQQEMVLHDNLACASPATARLSALATAMIALGREARAQGKAPAFPANMVSLSVEGAVRRENRFDLAKLYPDHPVFLNHSLAELQAELSHTRKRAADLKKAADDSAHQASHAEARATHAEAKAAHAEASLPWRSKLEAALALAALGHNDSAIELMLQGVKAAESHKDVRLLLEALLSIGKALAGLDSERARFLFATAQKLAARASQPEAIQIAAALIAQLPLPKSMAA